MSQFYYSQSLSDYLKNPAKETISIKYNTVPIGKMETDYIKKTSPLIKDIRQRLPHRLSTALIPMDEDMVKYIRYGDQKLLENHRENIRCLLPFHRLILNEMASRYGLPESSINTSIASLKTYYGRVFDVSFDKNDFYYASLANKCAQKDLQHTMLSTSNEKLPTMQMVEYPNLLFILNRYKYQINNMASYQHAIIPDYNTICHTNGIFRSQYNIHHITPRNHDQSFHIVLLGEWFCMYHKDVCGIYYGPMSYLDYLLTINEVIHNLKLCVANDEYLFMTDLVKVLDALITSQFDHNLLVEYFKNFESFLLMAADIRAHNDLSWGSFLEIVSTLQDLDQRMTGIHLELSTVMMLASGTKSYMQRDQTCTLYAMLMLPMIEYKPLEMVEMSTLHKFIYYAEIDENKSIEKYLKRVHTPRPIDSTSIKEMCALFTKLFIIAYVKKHKSCPRFLTSNRKTNFIMNAVQMNSLSTIETQPIMFFYDVYPYNCLSKTLTNDPIEFAKDKGALRRNVKLIPSDTQKEIMQVIQTIDLKVTDINLNSLQPVSPSVTSIPGYDADYYTNYPAMLQNKEREQKIEGRLFGTQNMNNKFALSRLMLLAKGAVSYIDQQYYTISDRARKLDLHDAAQLLIDPDNYSIMTDIEGHNQSMQYENTSELCYRIGLLYGEDDWRNLPLYFSNLDVYYCKQYIQETIHSTGQLGGIEGWMNPIWTLHTTLMMKLFAQKSGYDIKHLAVYSDDTAMIINLQALKSNILNDLYDKLTKHCIKYGMVVKVLQTVVSKSRYTMLRQHYFSGQRADATLKKIIACTIFNCEFCPNEDVEVDGMVSSINSAMELTNHPICCTFIKWYKAAVISLRSFQTYFNQVPTEDIVQLKDYFINKDIIQLLFTLPTSVKYSRTKVIDIEQIYNEYKTLLRVIGPELENYTKDEVLQCLKSKYGLSLNDRTKLSLNDLIVHMMLSNNEVFDMYFYRLIMPQSLGGANVITLKQQILTGQSDTMLATLDSVLWIIRNCFYNEKLGYYMLKASLSNYIPVGTAPHIQYNRFHTFLRDFDYSKLCTSFWPSNNHCKSGNDVFQSAVYTIFKRKVKNLRILYLLRLEEFKMGFYYKIINELWDNFESRIAMFYAENSVFYILNKLIKKVETTRSFLVQYPRYNDLVRSSFKQTINNLLELYKLKSEDYGDIDEYTDIAEYMMHRREIMYPHVKFMNYIEPQYDNVLYENPSGDSMFITHPRSLITVVRGLMVQRKPEFGNEALYKGEIVDPSLVCQSIEEFLLFKLASTTKWILSKDGYLDSNGIYLNNSILNACILSSSTLTKVDIIPMIVDAYLPSGGEVMHRIQNLQFNTFSTIRALPNYIQKFSTFIDQTLVVTRKLIDSNIHFDYVRFRCSVMAAFRSYLSYDYKSIYYHDLGERMYIRDVVDHFSVPRSYKLIHNMADWKIDVNYVPSERRIKYLTLIERQIYDNYELPILPINDTIERELIDQNADYMHTIYMIYKKHCNDSIYLYPGEDKSTLFNNVLKMTRLRYRECKDMSDDEVKEFCMKLARESVMTQINSYSTTKSDLNDTELRQDFCEYIMDKKGELATYKEYWTQLVNFANDVLTIGKHSTKDNFVDIVHNFRYTLNTPEYFKARNKIIECSMIHLIAKYTMTYDIDNISVLINKKSTISRSLLLIQNIELFEKEVPAIAFLIRSLDVDFLTIKAQRLLPKTINQMIAYAIDFDPTSYVLDVTDYSIAQTNRFAEPPVFLDMLSSVATRYYQVNPCELSTWDFVEKMIRYRKNIISLYSNPIMYYSTTGSDSLICIYNILKSIKNRYSIENVCDLTAGRGDAEFALTQLKIPHKSYGVVDAFTSAYYNRNVIYDFNYDITSIDTLSFLFDYQTVLIDVSFFKGSTDKLFDTLLYLLLSNLVLILRINAIKEYPQFFVDWLIEHESTIEILWTQEGNLAHHAVYLYINPRVKTTVDISKTIWFMNLVIDTKKLVSRHNIYNIPVQNFPNSVSNLIVSVPDYRKFTEELIDHEVEYTEVGLITKLKQVYAYISEVYLIPSRIRSKLFEQTGINIFTAHKHTFIVDLYKDLDLEYPAFTESKRIQKMKEHYNLLISGSDEICSVVMKDYTYNFMIEMRGRHPISQVRSAFATLCTLYTHNKDIINMDHYALSKYEDTIKVNYPLINAKMTTRIRQVYLALADAAVKGDYKAGIKSIMIPVMSSTYRKSEIISKIAIYKKMGTLYMDLRNSLKGWDNRIEYRSKLSERVYDAIGRRIRRTLFNDTRKGSELLDIGNAFKVPDNAKERILEWAQNFNVNDMALTSTIISDSDIHIDTNLKDITSCIPGDMFEDMFSIAQGSGIQALVQDVHATDMVQKDESHSYVPLLVDTNQKKTRIYYKRNGAQIIEDITDDEYYAYYKDLYINVNGNMVFKPLDQILESATRNDEIEDQSSLVKFHDLPVIGEEIDQWADDTEVYPEDYNINIDQKELNINTQSTVEIVDETELSETQKALMAFATDYPEPLEYYEEEYDIEEEYDRKYLEDQNKNEELNKGGNSQEGENILSKSGEDVYNVSNYNTQWGNEEEDYENYLDVEDIIDYYPEILVRDDDPNEYYNEIHDNEYFSAKHDFDITRSMLESYIYVKGLDQSKPNFAKRNLVMQIYNQRYKRAVINKELRSIDFPDIPYEYFDHPEIDYYNYKDVDPSLFEYEKRRIT